jgi:sec-independent protein translocase protein TatB
MFDIGWSEMAVILMVALIVIGPKDLPRVARTIGKWTGKARGMAREFQRSLDDMAREAELQDIKAEMDKLSRVDVRHRIEETIDPEGELRRGLAAPTGKPLRDDGRGGDDDGGDDDMDEPDLPALPPPAATTPVAAAPPVKAAVEPPLPAAAKVPAADVPAAGAGKS